MEIAFYRNKHKYFIYKTLGASFLFFLWLTLWVNPIGEETTVINNHYLEEVTEWLIDSSKDPQNSSQVNDNPSNIEQKKEISASKDPKEIHPLITTESSKTEKKDWSNTTAFSTGDLTPEELVFHENCLKHLNFCKKVEYTETIPINRKNKTRWEYLEIITFLDQSLVKWKWIQESLQKLVINNQEGKRRGGATREKITINLASFGNIDEFYKVLVHEFGHIVDLGSLQGKSRGKNGNFTEFGKVVFEMDDPSLEYYRYSRQTENIRQEVAKKEDFCSGYGMSNPFEDFAECFNLYLTNNQLFQEIWKDNPVLNKKYNFLANLFLGKYLSQGEQELYYQGWRPWDSTKI